MRPGKEQGASTRREWLSGFFGRAAEVVERRRLAKEQEEAAAGKQGPAWLAVIAGRDCLAYHGQSCRVCVDQCPEPGALVLREGLPVVVPNQCTGCRICQELCPAPVNAVRVVPRPPGLAAPSSVTKV